MDEPLSPKNRAAVTSVTGQVDSGFQQAAEKVREFPQSPGVYLMKDAEGRVIYIGKAKQLRSRASSYFSKGAEEEWRTAPWIHEIRDVDYIECESEVDALLMESRLIKDTQPKHNKELKDDKTFPYLMVTTREDFPRVEVTREPRDRGVKTLRPLCECWRSARCDSGPSAYFSVQNVLLGYRGERRALELVSSLPAGQH